MKKLIGSMPRRRQVPITDMSTDWVQAPNRRLAHFLSSEYLVNVIYDEAGRFIQIPDKTGDMKDVTALLKRITNANTRISLHACTCAKLAKNLSNLLPGVTVEGCASPALSVPGTIEAFSFPLPGMFEDYRNGRWVRPPCPDLQRIWPGGSKPGACFVAGTPIACGHGFRPIEEIRRGDTVVTWDPSAKRFLQTRVTKLDVHEGRYELLTLRLSTGESIQVTPDHPFCHEGGWVHSRDLPRVGSVSGALGGRVRILGAPGSPGRETTVYNLQTEAGTYLVGRAGLLVSGQVAPADAAERSLGRQVSRCG